MSGKSEGQIFVNAEHEALIIGGGEARVVGPEVAAGFGHFINQKTWYPSGSGLDWSGVCTMKLKVDVATPEEASSFLQNVLLGRNKFILAWLSERTSAIVGKPQFILANLDAIYLSFPGVKFLIGADATHLGGEMRLSFENFAECIDGRLLTAEMRPYDLPPPSRTTRG